MWNIYNKRGKIMDIFEVIDPKTRKADFSKIKSHPRLLFTEEKINESKENIKKYDLYKRFLSDVKELSEQAFHSPLPKQSDKNFGFAWRYTAFLPIMGTMYLLGKDEKYYDKILQWLGEFLTYEFTYSDHPDLDLTLVTTSTALIYDWFNDKLPEKLKKDVKNKLMCCAKKIYDFAKLDEDKAWIKMVMQNHNHLAMAAVATIALAVYEEEPETCQKYIDIAIERFSATFEVTGDDGAFHEGFGYWFYGFLTPFVLFQELKDNVGVNFFEEKWFVNTSKYLLLNYFGENNFEHNYEYFSFADDVGFKRTKECMLRLIASISGNTYLQYFADVSHDKKLTSYHGAFLNFIWNDPELPATPLKDSDYPLSHHFENYGYAFARENWSGDESCFGIHCGNPLGKKWQKVIKNVPFYEFGASHSHPDAGHFILFGKGQPLFYDDGYSYNKQTIQHNTHLINGKGQKGENITWFNVSDQYINSTHHIETFFDAGEYVLAVADMKDTYHDDALLTELKRYYLYLRNDDCLVIFDKIRAKKENELKTYFWPWDENITKYEENKYFISGEKANIKLVASDNLTGNFKTIENYTRYYTNDRKGLEFNTICKDGEFMYVITFDDASKEPKEAIFNKTEKGFFVTLKDKKFTVDTETKKVSVETVKMDKNLAVPVKLFSNGVEIVDFTPDKKDYKLKKLPWQKENYVFFTGTGYATPDYHAEFYNTYPVGLGKIGIKNISESSHYYRGYVMNALNDNPDDNWSCEMIGGYMIVELEKPSKIQSVILSFGHFDRFKTKFEILCSKDGKIYNSMFMKIADKEVMNIPINADEIKYIKIVNYGNSYNSFININGIGII